jgi:ABC-type transport system substrate-binding protein
VKNGRIVLSILVSIFVLACVDQSPQHPDYLRLRLTSNPTTLDPALIVDVPGGGIGAKLFNGLVRFDERLHIVPDVAEFWKISDDGLTYTFYLKKGISFSNGREVTADDFKYSFERVLSPVTRSSNTWVLDRIKGAKDFMGGKTKEIKGIKVKDDTTILITLEEPFSPFIDLLCMTAAYVVPREEVEKQGSEFSTHPVGTGPFVLQEWRHNRHLVLESRDDYFEGSPHVKGIIYKIIPEDLTAVAEFETGGLDILPIPASEFKRYRQSGQWRELVTGAPGINTYYLGFNCERPPFSDPVLRKAVNYAVDREKILKTLYEGRGELASGPVPPLLRKWPSPENISYDPERARQLMKEAGFPNGLTIKIYLTADSEVLDILEAIQGYLSGVGIHAELRQLEWSAYKDAINRGEPDAFWLSWWADYPDPENFLFPLFHSRNFGPAGNRTRYKNPEVDTLIEKGQKSMNENSRNEYYGKAEEMIVNDSPWVFFWHRAEFTVRQPRVKNYKIYPIYSIDKGMDVGLEG